jgi:hypothetical protein
VGFFISLSVALIAAIILFVFNPAQTTFYPTCQFKALTGLDCPGCGGLRALHQLLHGNVAAAFRLNALLVTLLPVGAWWAYRWVLATVMGRGQCVVVRPLWIWVGCAVLVIFGVVRNLHLPWLSWMAQ